MICYTLQTDFVFIDGVWFPRTEHRSSSLVYLLSLIPACSPWMLFELYCGQPCRLIGRS